MRFIYKLALVALMPISSAFASPAQTVVFDIQNMTCSMCKVTVKKAFQSAAGVEDVTVDYEHKTATITYDPAKADKGALAKASTNAGFPATVRK